MRKLTLVAAMLLLLPAASNAAGLEDLLVEKGVITKSEARTAMHDGGSKVYYNKGTRLDFADAGFTSKINADVITRYEYTRPDSDTGEENTSSFSVKRARLAVSGSALHEEFEYKVQIEAAGSGASLRDAYLQWNMCDWGDLKMGQYKTVFSRQQYNSATKLQFADRSIASDFYSVDRTQGLTGTFALNDEWDLSAGIYNGLSEGEGRNSVGLDTRHMGVVGIRGDLVGTMDAHSEGDVEHTEDLAVNWGAAALWAANDNALIGRSDQFGFNTDINVKSKGFSLHGELFYLNNDPDFGDKNESIGFYTQVGYFFVPKQWELAARYSYIDCDDGTALGNNIQGDVCGGYEQVNAVDVTVNYYWWKHQLKAQFGYAFLNQDADDAFEDDNNNTNRWIFQLSSWF